FLRVERDADVDVRSLTGGDGSRAAEFSRTVIDAVETKTGLAILPFPGLFEGSIILDAQRHLPLRRDKADLKKICVGVLEAVVDRLLGDAKEMEGLDG